jgi:hypothetical protein
MSHLHGAILVAGAAPVLRNVVERTSVLRTGLLVRRSALESGIECCSSYAQLFDQAFHCNG